MVNLLSHYLKINIRDGSFIKYSLVIIGVVGYMNGIGFIGLGTFIFFYKDFLIPIIKDNNTLIRLRITNANISNILLANNLIFVLLLNFWDILAKIMASMLYVILWNTEKLMNIWQLKNIFSFNLMVFLLVLTGNVLALSDIITVKIGSNLIQTTVLSVVFVIAFSVVIFLQNTLIIAILLTLILIIWYFHIKKQTIIPYFTHYLDD